MTRRIAFSKPTRDEDEFARLVASFREAGYGALQLKMGQFVPWLDDPAGFRARWGDEPGVTDTLIFFDALDDEGAARLERVLAFAAALGTARVVYCQDHPHGGVTRDELAGFAHRISGFGARARDRGIALSLHHHFDQPVMHPDDVRAFFGAVEPGTVGLTMDTAHLAKSGVSDIPAFVAEFGSLIDNVHLKDYADGRWRLLGEGSLDLEGILDALDAAGYDGWICVDEESDASLDDGLRVSRAWLDSHG